MWDRWNWTLFIDVFQKTFLKINFFWIRIVETKIKSSYLILYYIEASEPKWVNPVLKTIRVNSLRLGDLHIIYGVNLLRPGGTHLSENISYTKFGHEFFWETVLFLDFNIFSAFKSVWRYKCFPILNLVQRIFDCKSYAYDIGLVLSIFPCRYLYNK